MENGGTKEEKELFKNGDFEKITQLISPEYKAKHQQLTDIKVTNYQEDLNLLFDSKWNKNSIKYLRRKYFDPPKELCFRQVYDDALGNVGMIKKVL